MKKILFILLLLAQLAHSQVNLNLGLMAYYPFSGNGADASGNNNHPVFNNATSVADRFGIPNSAYFFNGSNNYMRILNSATLNTSNQMSLCAWVKVSGFYQGTCHDNAIIMKGDVDNVPGNYLLRFGDNIYTNFQNCANPVPDMNHESFYGHQSIIPVANTNPYVDKDRWYSVVWTSDGVNTKTYVNCQLTLTGNSGNLTFTNGYDLYLGRMNHPLYPYWFNGTMDEIRIYNRVLNTDEINAYGSCAGVPDLTSSQFFTTTQLIAGGGISEVMVVRNVGTGATTAPFTLNITNYAALTGLTITPMAASTIITIGFTSYTISDGWTFTPATGTFTCSNVIPAGGSANLGILITRGTGGSAGANGIVTQTSTIPPGTGGNETPTNNNSISNFLLKNSQ